MIHKTRVAHVFCEFVPDELAYGTLYISIPFDTAVHSCLCGCDERVVTPLSPTDWKLTYDGEVVSLSPSIGNWSFACQSHYWIRDGAVSWAESWSQHRIETGRALDRAERLEAEPEAEVACPARWWSRILRLFRRR